MKILIKKSICHKKGNLTAKKEYEVLDVDDDMPGTPDEYYKIKDDNGKEIWIDDWDCMTIL